MKRSDGLWRFACGNVFYNPRLSVHLDKKCLNFLTNLWQFFHLFWANLVLMFNWRNMLEEVLGKPGPSVCASNAPTDRRKSQQTSQFAQSHYIILLLLQEIRIMDQTRSLLPGLQHLGIVSKNCTILLYTWKRNTFGVFTAAPDRSQLQMKGCLSNQIL